MNDWFVNFRRTQQPEFTNNVEKYDWDSVFKRRTDKPVFEFNCAADKILGDPPNIPQSEKHEGKFCFHGYMAIPQEARDLLKAFIER